MINMPQQEKSNVVPEGDSEPKPGDSLPGARILEVGGDTATNAVQAGQNDEKIVSVGAATVSRAKGTYLVPLVLIFAFIVLFEMFWFSEVAPFVDARSSFEVSLVVPLFVVSIFYGYIRRKVEDDFISQFAADHGFSFQKEGVPYGDGTLFSLGHGPSWRDSVSGKIRGADFCLFNYRYIIGYGKGSRTYSLTVARVEYRDHLPPIFLQTRGAGLEASFGFSNEFPKMYPEKISLEGDFDKYFTLYTQKGFETEALQIVSPDFMGKLMDGGRGFSLEFIENRIYMYSHHLVSKKAELEAMYQLADYLVRTIATKAEMMESDIRAMREYSSVQK